MGTYNTAAKDMPQRRDLIIISIFHKIRLKGLIGLMSFTTAFAGTAAAVNAYDAQLIDGRPAVGYGTPIIDGKKDDIYTDKEQLITDFILPENSTIDDGSRAKVWLCWDYDALYVYALVTENTPSWIAANEYLKDSVEVFIDENNSKNENVDNNDKQYRVSIVGSQSSGLSAQQKFECAAINNKNGTYSVEMKCEWIDILPTDGQIVGFDVQVNDADETGFRQSCITWHSQSPDNWQNSVNYGEIVLILGEHFPKWNGTDPMKLSVNGYDLKKSSGIDSVIYNGVPYLPMRAVFSYFGADVAWNGDERAAYSIYDGKLIIMKTDTDFAVINGEELKSDGPIKIINGNTMLPLDFASKILGFDVEKDEVQGVIIIKEKSEEN